MLKLYAMCCGRLQFDRTLFFPDEAPGEQMTIEVPSFLIRHDRGVVLFDTGVDCFAHQDPIAHLGKRIASVFTLCAAPNENPIDQLRSVGLTADDVTHVINSHFHFDHCGCNALFPRATFIVQRAEMDMARAAKSPTTPPTGTIRSTTASSMANTTCSATARCCSYRHRAHGGPPIAARARRTGSRLLAHRRCLLQPSTSGPGDHSNVQVPPGTRN